MAHNRCRRRVRIRRPRRHREALEPRTHQCGLRAVVIIRVVVFIRITAVRVRRRRLRRSRRPAREKQCLLLRRGRRCRRSPRPRGRCDARGRETPRSGGAWNAFTCLCALNSDLVVGVRPNHGSSAGQSSSPHPRSPSLSTRRLIVTSFSSNRASPRWFDVYSRRCLAVYWNVSRAALLDRRFPRGLAHGLLEALRVEVGAIRHGAAYPRTRGRATDGDSEGPSSSASESWLAKSATQ